MFEDDLATWQEKVDAARRTTERPGRLAAERAKQYEDLSLEQVMEWWAEVMIRRTEWANGDELEVEVMAIFSVLGAKIGRGLETLRVGGFEHGQPMQ